MNDQFKTAEQIGLDNNYWTAVTQKLEQWCESNIIPAAALIVGRSSQMTSPLFFGRQNSSSDSPALQEDSIFLIASITKPIVAMGIMKLVEQGEILLSEKVHRFIPEFNKPDKKQITIRHLLTHTSGLPDMLTNNIILRQDHAPLEMFVNETANADLFFQPGHETRYQSMGFALLGQIIQKVTGKSCADYLRDEFFTPLGMIDTELGAPDSWYENDNSIINRIAGSTAPKGFTDCEDWGWNSRYWQQLGAPWGGLFTTPVDLARYCQMMLQKGKLAQTRVLGQATVETSIQNKLIGIRHLPEEYQRLYPWGLGWRMSWPGSSWNMGDLLSPSAYGHWGATGTVLWIDPEKDAFAIVLSTQPSPPSYDHIARISNMIAAAFIE